MAALTTKQKERFLELTREGWNRSAAAKQVGATGTQFKRITNRTSSTHDPDFTVRYLDAIAHKHPSKDAPRPTDTVYPPPRTTTDAGHTLASYITEDEQARFLEQVAQGVPRELAAREVGTSLVQFNRLARREPGFAARFADAYAEGYPNYQDWLRAKPVEFISNGNYAALRDQILIHLPEAAALRTSRHEVGGVDGGAIKILIEQVLPDLPGELIDQLIAHVEAGGQIEPAQIELPRAS